MHVLLQITVSITAHLCELTTFLIIVAIEFNRPMRWTRHDQSTAERSRGNVDPCSRSEIPIATCAQPNKGDSNSNPCNEYWIPVKRVSSIRVIKPRDSQIQN